MELEEIDVIIEQDGQVRIQVRGAKGGQCRELTKQLEEALGGQIVTREVTPEASEVRQEQAPERQWLGGR